MSRTEEKVAVFEVAALAAPARQVVIGGVVYYRVNPGVYLPWADRFAFHTVRWHPMLTHVGFDPNGAPPPTWLQSANIGAATTGLAACRCAIWCVPTAGIVPSTPNLPALNNCIVLEPGESVDLGGWFGDLLLAEGPQGSAAEPVDWTGGLVQAALGEAFSIVIDQAIQFGPNNQGATVLP